MQLVITSDPTPVNFLEIPLQDKDKLCPSPHLEYKEREMSIHLECFKLDIPQDIRITERHRSMLCEGWVRMSQVVLYAHVLTPIKDLQPKLSSIIGIFFLFRHLMCPGPEARVSMMYASNSVGKGVCFSWDCDALPGLESILVPARWAVRVLQYIEQGVQGIYINQTSPPCLYAKLHNGYYQELEPQKNSYGWKMKAGSSSNLTPSQVSLLV